MIGEFSIGEAAISDVLESGASAAISGVWIEALYHNPSLAAVYSQPFIQAIYANPQTLASESL